MAQCIEPHGGFSFKPLALGCDPWLGQGWDCHLERRPKVAQGQDDAQAAPLGGSDEVVQAAAQRGAPALSKLPSANFRCRPGLRWGTRRQALCPKGWPDSHASVRCASVVPCACMWRKDSLKVCW